MKNIGIDIDGVLVDTAQVYLDYIYRVTGRRYCQNEVTEYFFEDCLDVSKEEVDKAVEYMIDDDIWDRIPFYDNALKTIDKLASLHNIYIITSRPEKAAPTTLKWVKNNNIPAKKVIFTDMGTKLDYIKKHNLKLDYFIEDRLHFALEVSKSGTEVLLMDRPWNREYKKSNGLTRVKDWTEVEKYLLKDTI